MEATRPAAPRASASLTADPWVSINSIRVLAMDAVEQANSGHPGTPMALAPAAYLLWTRHLRHNPADPTGPTATGSSCPAVTPRCCCTACSISAATTSRWTKSAISGSGTPGRRGIPSGGTPPGSRSPPDPWARASATRSAWRWPSGSWRRGSTSPDATIVDHRTWALVSDGDLMEGVASEAAVLAGHLRLGKLALIYDDNRITIDGTTGLSFSEDVEPALRGLRLARAARGRRQRPRGHRRGARRGRSE